MSCAHEWAHCSGKNASYITKLFVEHEYRRPFQSKQIIVSTKLIFLGLKMGTSYLAMTQLATKVLFLLLFLSLTVVEMHFGGQLIGGLQVFL